MKWFAATLLTLTLIAATPYTAKQPIPASTKDVRYGRFVIDGLVVLFPKGRGQTFRVEMDSTDYAEITPVLLRLANRDTTLQANSLKAAKYRTLYDALHPPQEMEP